jgi:hypothetical protein
MEGSNMRTSKFILTMMLLMLAVVAAANVFVYQMPETHGAGGGQPAYQGTSGSPSAFMVEVAKGNVLGHSVVHKYGHGSIGTSPEPITLSTEYQMGTSTASLEIVSDDAADALDDVGAHEYTIWGIDANYDEVIQVVAAHATTGLTAVVIPTPLLRVYRWKVTASGAYASATTGSHVGQLTIRDVSDTPIWSIISELPYPQAQSEISCYTVPDGYTAYIVEHDIDVDSTKSCDVMLMARANIDDVVSPFEPLQIKGHYVGMTGHAVTPFDIPQGGFVARTDILYMGMVASGTADISVHFTLLLIKDGY